MNLRPLVVLLGAVLAAPAAAHELNTVALRLDEQAGGRVQATLKTPLTRDGQPVSVVPVFNENCRARDDARVLREEAVTIRQWEMNCGAPLIGQRVGFQGLDPGTPDAVVIASFASGETRTFTLDRHDPSVVLTVEPAVAALSLAAYLLIGIEHIFLGPDHLLFVLGLMLVVMARVPASRSAALKTLALTITAFTLAHSLTLALAVLGIWGLPAKAVEILIALSILLLAVELAQRERRAAAGLAPSLTLRKPWLVAFMFGLLHGFGFAGALSDVGLPEQARGWALLLFNLGVEIGQLLFVAAMLLLLFAGRRAYRRPLPAAAAGGLITLLGGISAYWALERLALWGQFA